MIRPFLLLALTAVLHLLTAAEVQSQTGAPALSPQTQQIIAGFDQQLKAEFQQEGIGSVSAVVFMGDDIVWYETYGKADDEKGIAADTATVYRIASLSKSITSYVMMLLVQNGTIKLDDPVVKYVPEIAQVQQNGGNDAVRITLRQLASHSSGLAREPGDSVAARQGLVSEWENRMLASIPVTMMPFHPGERYLYSNIGYAILGLALERAAQKPFIKMVEEMVFVPLHMNSSFFMIPEAFESHIATGYYKTLSGKIASGASKKQLTGNGYAVPNGGVFSTPSDYARFIMAQVRKTDQLEGKYRKMMQTIQIHENRNTGYGLGLFISDNNDIKIVDHSGKATGYTSLVMFSPESRIGVVMMRNTDAGFGRLSPAARMLVKQLATNGK